MTEDPVWATDAVGLLHGFDEGEVDAIITSPPFSGLPGRGDTLELVEEMSVAAQSALHADHGTLTLIVGSSPGFALLPFDVAQMVPWATDSELVLHSLYVWDRSGTMSRQVGSQVVTHDYVLHFRREADLHNRQPIHTASIIKTSMPAFNYGTGYTTPPDLAALLIERVSERGQLVVDPFVGLGEIGVQALHQGRRFAGCDISDSCVEIANNRLRDILPVSAA